MAFFPSQLFRTEAFVQNSSNDEKNDDNASYEDAQEPSLDLAGGYVAVLDSAATVVRGAPAGGCIIYCVCGVVGSVLHAVAKVFEGPLDTPCLGMALVLFRNKHLRWMYSPAAELRVMSNANVMKLIPIKWMLLVLGNIFIT